MDAVIPFAPSRTRSTWPWLVLFSRTLLFVGVQGAIALAYLLSGSSAAWESSAAWWPVGVVITNGICVAVMMRLFQAEGRSFWELFHITRATLKGDLLNLLGFLLIAGPIAFLPNLLLAAGLFGNSQAPLALLVRPLPMWAAVASLVLFPLTQGLAETPLYFGFVMPHLEANGLRPWQAVALPALMLGLQHVAIPLVFDGRFVAWRALMFLPFAVLVGIVLHWRPRLLPYIAIIHLLMDLSIAVMFLGSAY